MEAIGSVERERLLHEFGWSTIDAEVVQLAIIEKPERIPGLLIFAPFSKRSRNGGTKWTCQPIVEALHGARVVVTCERHQSTQSGG
jgi:hypothetical protein